MPNPLTDEAILDIERLAVDGRRLQKGEALFRINDPFRAVYAIRVGYVKTTVVSESGIEQVTGFQMQGELVGLDGIVDRIHTCSAIALNDVSVCILPFEQLTALAQKHPLLQNHLHRVMSREIVREQAVMVMLGSLRAEERVAAFLLNLSQRLSCRGQSESEFLLRMSRDDIGSYLGLKVETVSRAFTRLAVQSIIRTESKNIKILDLKRLTDLATARSEQVLHRAA